MTATILTVFLLVYLGMILGGLPFLQLDRTGVALVGAIAMISVGALDMEQAAAAVHLPTLMLLFSFMVLSAQMRLGGFYTWLAKRIGTLRLSPPALLGALIFIIAGLSAVFSNDIVCLAVTPVLIDACRGRGLDPLPFLLAVACAANIGSAVSLIGNPQNMLIGQTLNLSFSTYSAEAAAPVVLGLLATWCLIARQRAGRWLASEPLRASPTRRDEDAPVPFDRWQTVKGFTVALALMLAFLFGPWPREHVALAAAGLLLMNRRLHSHRMLGLVDWELLVLFIGLFVVNAALEHTGLVAAVVADLATDGLDLHQPGPLFGATLVLSNLVSNVPAVMFLLPLATHPLAGLLLALVSTLAGNLLIVGSIANIIVVGAAARYGLSIDWRQHAQVGIPVTFATLALCAAYFWLRLQVMH